MKKEDESMKKNEEKNNKEENKNEETILNDLEEPYSKFLIEDIDFLSQSSNDDIDTKLNKMLDIIKKGGNINNIIDNNKNKNIKKDIKEEERKKEEKNEKEKDNKKEIENKKEEENMKDESIYLSGVKIRITQKKRRKIFRYN